jgi:hypothetical protein
MAQARQGELSQALQEGLARFPLTLRALQKRLGMNIDNYIRIYILCPSCGTRYTMATINGKAMSGCPHLSGDKPCGVELHTEFVLYGGVRKRTSRKSSPYIPVHGTLERFLLHPGMAESLQHWRRPVGDEPRQASPTSQ